MMGKLLKFFVSVKSIPDTSILFLFFERERERALMQRIGVFHSFCQNDLEEVKIHDLLQVLFCFLEEENF